MNQVLNAGTGDVRLVVGGGVSQTAAGVITADELGILAGAAVDLNNANNDANTLAVETDGQVDVLDVDDLIIGAVGTGGNCGFTAATGIDAGTGGVTVTTGIC